MSNDLTIRHFEPGSTLALALAWYGDRLSPDYASRSAAQVEQILASVGLTGPFWRLPTGES